jgi:RNA polymerase sigma factor (sigma-70 family)
MNRILSLVARSATADAATDSDLVRRYALQRDPAAFEAIVRRHGPMVLGVCRRILRHGTDADDAFQATFLVLIHRIHRMHPVNTVPAWLYGVARRTALRARQCRRQSVPLPELPAVNGAPDARSMLDDELARLPERYRLALILCDLEGRTIREAAARLGWPPGTVATRVRRGRALLAARLALPVVVRGAILGPVAGHVPPSLIQSTLSAAVGGPSPAVANLSNGVLRAMWIHKLRTAVVLVVAVTGVGLGAGFAWHSHVAAEPRIPPAPTDGKKAADHLTNTLLALDQHLWEASAKGDWQERAKFLADDMVSVSVRGTYGKADNVEADKHVRLADWKIDDAKVVPVSKDVAVLTYRYSCKLRSVGGQFQMEETRKDCRVTYVWANRDGGWVIVYCFDDHGDSAGMVQLWEQDQKLPWPAKPGK